MQRDSKLDVVASWDDKLPWLWKVALGGKKKSHRARVTIPCG